MTLSSQARSGCELLPGFVYNPCLQQGMAVSLPFLPLYCCVLENQSVVMLVLYLFTFS